MLLLETIWKNKTLDTIQYKTLTQSIYLAGLRVKVPLSWKLRNSEKSTFILRTDKMRDKNVSNEYMYFTMEQRIDFLEKDRSKIRRENERLKKENQILRGELKRQKELLWYEQKTQKN